MSQVENFDKYMELGKVITNEWGTGSSRKSSFQSVKYTLRDDKVMKVKFMMIVNLPNNHKFAIEMKNRFIDEGMKCIENSLKDLQEKYKDNTNGKEIQFKIVDNSVNDSVEFLYSGQYRPSKHGYFRLECLVQVD